MTIRFLITLLAATLTAAPLQAGTRPHATVQTGPYSWTTGTYQYDAAGNITTIGPWTFAYDPLNRLSTSHMTTPDTVSDQTYVYDPFGNMIEQSTSGLATPLPIDITTNHLDTTIAGYDDSGNTIQYRPPGSAHTYGFTYDAFNMVTGETADNVTTAYFVYTADDERLRIENTTSGTKHWRMRGQNQAVLRDIQLSGTTWSVSRDYVYRGPLLAALTATRLENFSIDHLNSPRLISDAVGNRIALHTYLPFGRELGATPDDGGPLKFTGHERDSDPAGGISPIDYMHARYYTPDVARFLSVDMHPGRPAAPQSWNRYPYARGNPLKYFDPDGEDIKLAGDIGNVATFLVNTARHAQGRADLAAIAHNHHFVATFHNTQIYTQSQINLEQNLARHGFKRQIKPANTNPDHASGATAVDINVDANAVSAVHPDKTGVTTIEHEVGSHAMDFMNNVPYDQIRASDTNGTAELYGQTVANSPMDMTEQEASDFLMGLLAPLMLPPTLTDVSEDFNPPEE